MIHAEHVRDETDRYEAVVLQDDDGFTFSIQRALEVDEEDRSHGMDTYCLVADAGAVIHGGVAQWSRDEADLVVLVLTEEAAETLGVPTEFDLEFDPAVLDAIDPVVQRLIADHT